MLGHRKLASEDYVAILKRRRWLILAPALILPLIAFGITFLIPAQYLSQTLVLIEDQKVGNDIVKPMVTTSLDNRLSSMREQILSRSRIQPIIERYNLYPGSRYNMDDRVDLTRKAIAIIPIKSQIVTTRPGLPGFFITFTASDPRTAQLVCTDITSLFVTASLKIREDSAQGTTDFLKSQLAEAKRSLDDQDAKLATFQSKFTGKLPGEEAPNLNMLTSLNTQLEGANQALSGLQQAKAYQESMLAQAVQNAQATNPTVPGTAVIAPQVQQNELQNLLAQEADLTAHYTDSYPDVITVRRKIADLRRKMAEAPAPSPVAPSTASINTPRSTDSVTVQQLRAQVRSADIGIQAKERQQAALENAIRTYQDRIQSSPQVEAEYKDLTRDYQTAQKFYDDLLAKMNDAQMGMSLERQQEGEQFTVMDGANLPDAPTFPNRPLFAAGGLVGGFVLGLILAAFLEYKDTALRTEQDVWAFTQLPTLAIIAYSGEIEPAAGKPGLFARFKGLFGRKPPEETLTKAHG